MMKLGHASDMLADARKELARAEHLNNVGAALIVAVAELIPVVEEEFVDPAAEELVHALQKATRELSIVLDLRQKEV